MSDIDANNTTLKKNYTKIDRLYKSIKLMFGRWVVVIGMLIISLLMFIAIFAPFVAPYDPLEQNLKNGLLDPSKDHLLGTDELGRDVFSRIIYGSRTAIMVGLVAVSISGGIGVVLGLIAGYFGGWAQSIIMRFIDTLMALPPMILMLAIAAVMGSGLKNVMIAVGIGMLPTYCRLMCGQVLSLKENDYIMAARAIGANDLTMMVRHILPNAFPPLIVLITLNMGVAILAEASLSYLGIGISPPTPTWGAMVSGGYRYLLSNPAMSFAPGIAIFLVVLGFNLVGDGIRDALDPRLRGKI